MLEKGENFDDELEFGSNYSTDEMFSIQNLSDNASTDSNEQQEESKSKSDWIPDDYDKLMKIFRRANLIRDGHTHRTHRNSFKGEDFISFIMREQNLSKL